MIVNRQRAVRVSVSDLNDFLERAQRKLRIPAGAVTVCLVDNAQMARWNHSFRHKRGVTDVLSFPADGAARERFDAKRVHREDRTRGRSREPKSKKDVFSSTSFVSSTSSAPYLGDIAVAPAVARENARRFGRTLADELRILILHGVIHLMGYDHETDHGEMNRFEQSIRRSLGLAQR